MSTNFSDILLGFERTLHLESLAELGRPANLTQVEVIACVVDVRGFTKFVQDDQADAQRLAPEFIREFFSIFPKAVLREAWNLEPEPHHAPTEFQVGVRNLIVPRLAKKMGDGVFLVWEVDGHVGPKVKQGLRYAILDIIGYVQESFYELIRDMAIRSPFLKWNMKLGVGLAAGQAWRHDYDRGGQIDYSGSPMNLASRLQDLARPQGVCVHARFEANHLLERCWAGEGEITKKPVKGLDHPVHVWCSDEKTLWLRKPRTLQGADSARLITLLRPPYFVQRRDPRAQSRLALSADDLQTLLEIRENLEAWFAQRAASSSIANPAVHLEPLIADMEKLVAKTHVDLGQHFRVVGQRFHEAIAFLSGATEIEAQEHSELVRSLHEATTNNRNYPQTPTDLREMYQEHREIAQFIIQGDGERAGARMHRHLKKHHDRVKVSAFGSDQD